MCGIAGIVSFNGNVNLKDVENLATALKHRGPDDEGYLAIKSADRQVVQLVGVDSKIRGQRISEYAQPCSLALAHRRLSIIDLSAAGHQPMADPDQEMWIVYNGEVYNFPEIKTALTGKMDFHSKTDTEVVLAAYRQWGAGCLERFNGMWAFVIYDRRKNILFGARDRFGVKPFYYFHDGKKFVFASEIKALIRLPFIGKRVNRRAVFDYLAFGLEENEEEGFFQSIFELMPGHAFELDLATGQLKKWRYYRLETTDRWESFDPGQFEKYKNATSRLITQAVDRRLRSDVPVGTCLSGGVDSSAIVCTVNRLLKERQIPSVSERQRTFTACYEGSVIDESRWAKKVVDHTQTEWFPVYPKLEEFWRDLETLVYAQEMPFGSSSIYAQYRVMQRASSQGIKVLLNGQGGDELFGGYTPMYGAFFADILSRGDGKRFVSEWSSLHHSPANAGTVIRDISKLYTARLFPAGALQALARGMTDKGRYIAPEFWRTYQSRYAGVKDRPISLNRMLAQYMGDFNLKSLLRYEDRNSMAFSLEARIPFADDLPLIEEIFRIPGSYKICHGYSKSLLREAMAGVIPEDVRLRRDKIGFAVPEYAWMRELKERFRSLLGNGVEEFVNVKKLSDDWENILTRVGHRSLAYTDIWRYFNLAVWMKVMNPA